MIKTILLDMAPSPSTAEKLGIPVLIIFAVVVLFLTTVHLITKVQKKNKDLITAQKEAQRKAEKEANFEAQKRAESIQEK